MDAIHSASNPLVKLARAAGSGRAEGFVLLEGDRLLDEARGQGWDFEVVLLSSERTARIAELAAGGLPVRTVEPALLSRVSRLVHSPGVLAVARVPAPRTLDSLVLDDRSLVVVVAGVQDPGNLGAIARTAEAAGAQALILLPGGCGPWNDKALRGSMGSLLRLPVLAGEDAAAVAARFRARGGRLVRAATRGGVPLAAFDWTGPVSLWVTAETGEQPDTGPSEADFEGVTIPMAPHVESLNVAAAAAVLLFAAGRVAGGGS